MVTLPPASTVLALPVIWPPFWSWRQFRAATEPGNRDRVDRQAAGRAVLVEAAPGGDARSVADALHRHRAMQGVGQRGAAGRARGRPGRRERPDVGRRVEHAAVARRPSLQRHRRRRGARRQSRCGLGVQRVPEHSQRRVHAGLRQGVGVGSVLILGGATRLGAREIDDRCRRDGEHGQDPERHHEGDSALLPQPSSQPGAGGEPGQAMSEGAHRQFWYRLCAAAGLTLARGMRSSPRCGLPISGV